MVFVVSDNTTNTHSDRERSLLEVQPFLEDMLLSTLTTQRESSAVKMR